jgi:hypothetical protein
MMTTIGLKGVRMAHRQQQQQQQQRLRPSDSSSDGSDRPSNLQPTLGHAAQMAHAAFEAYEEPDFLPLHDDSFLLELDAYNQTFCLHMHPNYHLFHPESHSYTVSADRSPVSPLYEYFPSMDRVEKEPLLRKRSTKIRGGVRSGKVIDEEQEEAVIEDNYNDDDDDESSGEPIVKAYRGFVVALQHHSDDTIGDGEKYSCDW